MQYFASWIPLYNPSASFNGPNYHYRYALDEWIIRF